MGDVKVSASPGNIGHLIVNGISAHCTAEWSYQLGFLYGDGTVSLDLGGASAGNASVSLEQRDGKPHLTSQSVAVTTESTHLEISGGISGFIATLFKSWIMTFLEETMSSNVETQIVSLINNGTTSVLDSF